MSWDLSEPHLSPCFLLGDSSSASPTYWHCSSVLPWVWERQRQLSPHPGQHNSDAVEPKSLSNVCTEKHSSQNNHCFYRTIPAACRGE